MHTRKNESPATHLLISMLIRYPEVSSVRYEPETQSLFFSFFLQGQLDLTKQSECIQELTTSFEICADIDRRFPAMGKVCFSPLEGLTLVTYQQAINQVKTSEIRLLTTIVQNHFSHQVALDPLAVEEVDLEMQEDLIDRLLDHRDILTEEKQIVAYRDGGKVFVYNR